MKSLRYFLFCTLALIFTLFSEHTAHATMRQYTLMVSTGTAYDMSTGATTVWTGTNSRFFAASGLINIGFPLLLDSVSYTQLQVYTSGVISLGSGTLGAYTTNKLAGANTPIIAPYWDSLGMTGTQGGCAAPKVRYKVFGAAPNRVFVVEWFDQETVWQADGRGTFQVRLYEDGKIEYFYQTMNNCSTCGTKIGQCKNSTASIGLANSATNFLSVTPAGITATKSTTIANDAVNIDALSTPIASSTLYTFVRLVNAQLKVTPKTLVFDTAGPGSIQDLCVTVTNVGTEGPLTFSAPTISGSGASAYSVPTLPSPLAPGASASYCIRYSPSSTGPYNASVTINSNGLDSGAQSVTVSGTSVTPLLEVIPFGSNTKTKLFRFARVHIGDTLEQKFLVRNVGGGKLVISPSSSISGTYFHYYMITRIPAATGLSSGMADTVAVKFMPRREGSSPAQLSVINNSTTSPYLMDLVGIGILPRIEILPSNSVTFDSTALGDTVCKTISVYNSGSETLILRKQYFTSNDGDFKVTFLSGADTNIPPTESRIITICFRPLAGGQRIAGIRILTNIPQTFEPIDGVDDGTNNGGPEKYIRRDTGYVEIGISGNGYTQGKLTSNALTGKPFIDSSLVGVELCRTVDITNFGDGDVTLTSMAIVGAASGDYTFKTVQFPYFLHPKKSVSVELCGKPSVRGSRPVNFSVFGIANDKSVSYSTPIDVKGLIACAKSDIVALFIKSKVYVGMSDTQTVTIKNCGDNAGTYTGTIADSEYTLLPPATVSSIPPGDSARFSVIFTPRSRGNKTGTLKITIPGLPAITIQLLGEGICAVPKASPFTINAPVTAVRDTSEFSFPVANNGNADWVHGAAFVTPDSVFSFVASKSDTVIKAGTNGMMTVSFHPRSLGTYFGIITFPNGGPCEENTLTANLSGTAEVNAVNNVSSAEGYALEQNVPNPALGKTSITYTVPKEVNVRIIISDITGKVVKELVNGHVSSGTHEIKISTNDLGSGTYIYILESGTVRLTRQMVINK